MDRPVHATHLCLKMRATYQAVELVIGWEEWLLRFSLDTHKHKQTCSTRCIAQPLINCVYNKVLLVVSIRFVTPFPRGPCSPREEGRKEGKNSVISIHCVPEKVDVFWDTVYIGILTHDDAV